MDRIDDLVLQKGAHVPHEAQAAPPHEQLAHFHTRIGTVVAHVAQNAHLVAGDRDKALEVAEAASRSPPRNPLAWRLLGEIRTARNLDKEPIRKPGAKISRSIAEEVAETGKPLNTINAQTDERLSRSGSVTDLKLRAFLEVDDDRHRHAGPGARQRPARRRRGARRGADGRAGAHTGRLHARGGREQHRRARGLIRPRSV